MELLTILSAVLGVTGAVAATPPGQALAAKYMRRVKQERALARLKAIPEYKIGARLNFYSPDAGGGSAKVGDTWTLAEMSVGRILLTDTEGATEELLPMTCQEFEAGTAIIIRKAPQ